jgi:hypothetical protein
VSRKRARNSGGLLFCRDAVFGETALLGDVSSSRWQRSPFNESSPLVSSCCRVGFQSCCMACSNLILSKSCFHKEDELNLT